MQRGSRVGPAVRVGLAPVRIEIGIEDVAQVVAQESQPAELIHSSIDREGLAALGLERHQESHGPAAKALIRIDFACVDIAHREHGVPAAHHHHEAVVGGCCMIPHRQRQGRGCRLPGTQRSARRVDVGVVDRRLVCPRVVVPTEHIDPAVCQNRGVGAPWRG